MFFYEPCDRVGFGWELCNEIVESHREVDDELCPYITEEIKRGGLFA
jgi:hypothetical protein